MIIKKLFFIFGLVTLFYACNKADKDKDENYNEQNNLNFKEHYSLEIIDTIRIRILGNVIDVADFSHENGNMIVCDQTDLSKITITDSIGNVLNTINLSGEGNDEAGTFIYSVGYLDDSTIIVNSNRGFFYYNLRGNLLSYKNVITPLQGWGAGTIPRIRSFMDRGDLNLITHLKSSVNGNFFSKQGYEEYKALTVYNTKTGQINLMSGYDEKSIFRREEVNFGNPLNLFDLSNKYLYSLHSPDPLIYRHKLSDVLSVDSIINIYPEHFNLPYKLALGSNVKDLRDYVTNSQFSDINVEGNLMLITYRSGIPQEEYTTKSKANMPELFKKFMKYYMVLFLNDKKIANDIELPYGCTGVSFFKNKDCIIMNTNATITETDTETIFYKCRLVQSK